jgi:hypothetical protein
MGSSRPRNSTRARKARSVKRTKSSSRRPRRLPAPTKSRLPAAIELATMSNGVPLRPQLACCIASTRPSAAKSKMPAESRLKPWRMQPSRPT